LEIGLRYLVSIPYLNRHEFVPKDLRRCRSHIDSAGSGIRRTISGSVDGLRWKVNTNVGLKKIVEGAYLIHLGSANAVLLDGGPELALVDAGYPDKASLVFDAIRQLGRNTRDLRHLIFTHGHPDHIGRSAAIVRETGATTYMHALDAPFAEAGGPFRPMNPAPGLLPRTAYPFVWRPRERMEAVRIDRHMADGETLPIAGGLHVVHIPGHSAGQVAFLWQGERLLIAGDVASTRPCSDMADQSIRARRNASAANGGAERGTIRKYSVNGILSVSCSGRYN
jgi:glyoxylase-like metal-dependent hydrolase (beta-lactamase superfamily II)